MTCKSKSKCFLESQLKCFHYRCDHSYVGNINLTKAKWRVVCHALCFILSKGSLAFAVTVKYGAVSIINSNLHEFIT